MRDNKFSVTEYPIASGLQPIYLRSYEVRIQLVDANW